jgi:site-specific recombinase XerD
VNILVKFVDEVKGHRLVGGSEELLGPTHKFLESVEVKGLSPRTVRAYAFDLLFLIRWLEETKQNFQDLKQADLLAFIAYQQKQGSKPRSINRRLTTCELFYRFRYDQPIPGGRGVLYPAPHYKDPGRDRSLGVFQLRKPSRLQLRVKVPRTLISPLDVNEVNTFLSQVSRYRDLGIILLMLLCGLRSAEVLALQLEDIIFEDQSIRVHGKGNRERILPFAKALIEVLQKYLRLERPLHCKCQNVFVILQGKRRGYPMTLAGLRTLFRYRRILSTITRANPHLWRHTFACDLARTGVQLPILQRMMGHSDPQVTLQYVHLSMVDIADEYHRAMARIQNRYDQTQISTS